jgi:FkbM family methyltransferase
VDLGANIGLASRLMALKYPQARIVAVEPEQGNVAVLRRNLAHLGERAVVVEACIGAIERRVTLTTENGEFGFHMAEIDLDTSNKDLADVAVRTMSWLLEEFGFESVDLLKCDIEGAEAELFQASSAWINKVKVAIVECHGDFTVKALCDAIAESGGAVEVLAREPNPAFACEVVTLGRLSGEPKERSDDRPRTRQAS